MSKSYTASYNELNAYKSSLCKALENCQQSLNGISAAISALVSSGNISGATADRMRSYFSDIHGKILENLTETATTLRELFSAYLAVYLSQVDGGFDFYIPSNKVRSIDVKMALYQDESEEFDDEAKAILNRISAIFSPPCALVVTDPGIYEALSKDITEMLQALDQVESSYRDLVENTISDSLVPTRQTIQANINQDKMHKKTYSPADNGVEYHQMVATTAGLNEMLAANKEIFDASKDLITQFNEKQAEYHLELAEREKREEQVKLMKLGVTALKLGAGAAVIFLTGGAGTPFVVASIAVGVGGGALSDGIDAFGEQYIESGTANLDWGKIGRSAFIGGIKGGASSAISLGIGYGFEQLGSVGVIADLGSASSPLVKFGMEYGSKVLEDEFSNILSNGVGRFLDAGAEDWVNNGGTFKLDVDKGMDSAFDDSAIVHDAVESFFDTSMSFGIEKTGEKLFGMDKITKDTKLTPEMVGGHAVISTASEVGSGILSRGAATLAEDLFIGMSFEEAKDDAAKQALDGEKIANDTFSGVIKGATKPGTTKAKEQKKYEKYVEEVNKNIEEDGVANTKRERQIIEKMRAKGDWDDYDEEDEANRKGIINAAKSKEGKNLSGTKGSGKKGPAADGGDSFLTEEEKTHIMEDFVDQNVTKARLPQSNGRWSDPQKPGDSMWIPDDDATFTYKQGGKEITMTYGELKRKYNIKGIEYRNNDPVFNTPQIADQKIGAVEFDRMPTKRQGKGGSYEKFYQEADERLGGDSKDYLEENGLTIHESADRKTVVAIPTEINAAFAHTGGISEQKSVEAVSEAWDEMSGGRGFTLSRTNTPTGTLKNFDSEKANKTLRQFYNSYKKK